MPAIEYKTDKRDLIVETVRRWGDASSDAILDKETLFFFAPGCEGLIGYKQEGKCAIVFGDPICPDEELKKIVTAFHHFCDEQRWNVVYITASETFARWSRENFQGLLIECGEEVFMNPGDDPRKKKGNNASLVRRKERHAKNEGVEVLEYEGQDPALEAKIENVAEEWLKNRKGPQIFISSVRLFEDRPGKRWFYAKVDDRIVGVIVASHLEKHQGYLINRLMITPDAPHGTPEMLVVQLLEQLDREGAQFVTFGTIPAPKLGLLEGFSTFMTNLFRFGFQLAVKILHLEGKKKFWEKFDPQTRGTFIVLKNSNFGINELKAVMKAMNVSF